MDWLIITLALTTFASTLIGGTLAIRFKRALPYFFAFASGSLIAVTFFDILPESLELAQTVTLNTRIIWIAVVASFVFYTVLERIFLIHEHKEGEEHGHIMGPIGAGSLVIHSTLDGVAIGAAYFVNHAVGIVVAFAVIFHDFTDGINTVTLMLKNKQHVNKATLFLLADALAPILGIAATFIIAIPQAALAVILGIFAGEFIYIGAVNLLPETYKNPNWKTITTTILAIILIFGLTSLIEI